MRQKRREQPLKKKEQLTVFPLCDFFGRSLSLTAVMLRTAHNTLLRQTRALSTSTPALADNIVGMRRETKNRWERRAPLTPGHIRTLRRRGVRILVQPSTMRYETIKPVVDKKKKRKESESERRKNLAFLVPLFPPKKHTQCKSHGFRFSGRWITFVVNVCEKEREL